MYLNWRCLNNINILMAPKMLEIGEGLWYIITSGQKESQHFIIALVFILSQKQMSEIEKKKRGMLT